jgi:hypothetical protein
MRLPHRLDLASRTVQTTQPQLVGKVPVLLEAMKILLLAMTTVAGPLGKTRVILLLVENGSRLVVRTMVLGRPVKSITSWADQTTMTGLLMEATGRGRTAKAIAWAECLLWSDNGGF